MSNSDTFLCGQSKEPLETIVEKDPAAVALGRKGGLARASKLSSEERIASATKAAEERWRKEKARQY